MSLYEMMTAHIDSYTNTAIILKNKTGQDCDGVYGMIDGMKNARDMLTIETASMESAR